MAGDAYGDKTQVVAETTQVNGREQAQEEQPQVSGKDRKTAIAEPAGS